MSNTIFLVKKVKYILRDLMPFLFFALTSQDQILARRFHLGCFSVSLVWIWAKGVSLWVWDVWLRSSSSQGELLKDSQAASRGLTGKFLLSYATIKSPVNTQLPEHWPGKWICVCIWPHCQHAWASVTGKPCPNLLCDLTSIPGCALTQTLHKDPTPFAWAPNTIFLSLHICVFMCLLLALLTCTWTHLPSPGTRGGMVAPVFTWEFPAKVFVDKPVNKYFPASVSLNKSSHECSFASKFLDKSSSVHISASTCFGICLPIHI